MDIRNCRRCNRIFQYKGSKYCSSCMVDLDQIFITVRDYIYDNPDANIVKVSEDTGVEEDLILEFLKQGRLELSSPGLDYVCERCAKPITTGTYCQECINELDREMKRGLGEAERNSGERGRDSTRMYISDYRRSKKYK